MLSAILLICIDFLSLQQSAYHQPRLGYGIRDGRSFFIEKSIDLKEHYQLRSGLFQRIILNDKNGPLLYVDAKHRPFPRAYETVIDLLHDIKKEHKNIKCDLSQPLNENVAQILTGHLAGLEICYHDGVNSRVLKFLELGNSPASEKMLEKEWLTVEKYFNSRQLPIKNASLQCIRIGVRDRYISVPMEYCSILDDQVRGTKSKNKHFFQEFYRQWAPINSSYFVAWFACVVWCMMPQ